MDEKKRERLFGLDLIRAVSVLIIAFYHFNLLVMRHTIQENVNLPLKFANGDFGQLGVILFFIISGASLGIVYGEKIRIKEYLKKRWVNIYPLFYIMYSACFVYLYWKNKGFNFREAKPAAFILTILGLDGYTNSIVSNYYILGTWFLGCIVLLYLCFPILNYMIKKWPKVIFVLLLAFYIFVVQTYSMRLKSECNFIVRIFDFSLGIFYVHLLYNKRKKFGLFSVIVAAAISLIIFFVALPINRPYKITVLGVCVFIVLMYAAEYIKGEKIIKLVNKLSSFSFPVFLCHLFVEREVLRHFYGRILSYADILMLALIIAGIIWISTVFSLKLNRKIQNSIIKKNE